MKDLLGGIRYVLFCLIFIGVILLSSRIDNLQFPQKHLIGNDKYAPFIRITDSVNSWGSWKSVNSINTQIGILNGLTIIDSIKINNQTLYINKEVVGKDTLINIIIR
jgi:hypothetical protein